MGMWKVLHLFLRGGEGMGGWGGAGPSAPMGGGLCLSWEAPALVWQGRGRGRGSPAAQVVIQAVVAGAAALGPPLLLAALQLPLVALHRLLQSRQHRPGAAPKPAPRLARSVPCLLRRARARAFRPPAVPRPPPRASGAAWRGVFGGGVYSLRVRARRLRRVRGSSAVLFPTSLPRQKCGGSDNYLSTCECLKHDVQL